MEVYDQAGNLLEEYDLERGYLVDGTKKVHHKAVEGAPEVGHFVTVREYPETGGMDVEWIVDVPGVKAREAWDEEIPIQIYVPYTDEELAQMERERKAEEQARQDAVARQEISDALIAAQINTLVVPNATALRWKRFYPEWKAGVCCAAGFRARHGDKLFECLQAHTTQTGWEPDAAASLWKVIDEEHAGTQDDPIPYGGNMELFEGKYYAQDGAIYRCTRGTGQPVYHALSALVGLYVEVVR